MQVRILLSYRRLIWGDGEMVPSLRALLALLEDLGSVPSTHIVSHKHLYVQLWGSDALFWPLQVGMHAVHLHYMQAEYSYT